MLRLVYLSTATRDFSQTEIDSLVTRAADKNAKLDITGVLAYNGRNFCQLLEGPPTVVRALFDSIAQDPRHAGVKLIGEKSVEARKFPEWSMHRVRDLDFTQVTGAMDD